MVRSTRVPSHELAKLKASKPMLVIPQPVLRIHECLDENVRMAQVESNAYIALGIKEEPIDEEYDADGRHYEDADFTPTGNFDDGVHYNDETCFEENAEEIEGMRTTRASKRKRLAGLIKPSATFGEDDNNNSKKTSKKQTSKGKKSFSPPEFHPIVLSVESLAPTEAQIAISHADLPNSLLDQKESDSNEVADQGNNNVNENVSSKADATSLNNPTKLRIRNHLSMAILTPETITPSDSPSELNHCSEKEKHSQNNSSEETEALLEKTMETTKETQHVLSKSVIADSHPTAETTSQAVFPGSSEEIETQESSLSAIDEEQIQEEDNQDFGYEATSSSEEVEFEVETIRRVLLNFKRTFNSIEKCSFFS